MMKKVYIVKSLLFLFWLFSASFLFSQNDSLGYNAAYWNGYADKLQLPPDQRLEFLNAHKRLKDGVPQSKNQHSHAFAAKNSTASTFAGACINADFETGNFTGWPGHLAIIHCSMPLGAVLMRGDNNSSLLVLG